MTKKKLEKLKKIRLWPSILLFVTSLFVGAILIAVEFSVFTTYVIESRHMQSLIDMRGITGIIDMRLRWGDDMQTALSESAREWDDSRQLVILDEGNHIVASHGETTVDISRKVLFDIGETQEIYWDRETIRTASPLLQKHNSDSDDTDRLDAVHMLLSMIVSQAQSLKEAISAPLENSINDAVMECVYWQSMPLAADEGHVLMKTSLTIRKDDLIFGVLITGVSALMFLIILSVQFMGVVSKVKAHRRMERLFTLDPVTGGNNRVAFMQKADAILEKRVHSGRTFAIADFSIMKYHGFCTLHGTEAGEALLTCLDRALTKVLDSREVVGHMGGPDFALLLYCPSGENSKQKTVQRLLKVFESLEESLAEGQDGETDSCSFHHVAFQVGLCFSEPADRREFYRENQQYADVEELYVNAGIAKASIAQDESECIACFSQKMREDQFWQHKVENAMQAALNNEEFQVYIQPKYNPQTGRLQGAEALVRWLSPSDGMIPPGRFIPIFEKTGFITKLDDYMISHIAQLQSRWIAEGKKVVPVSVNVSRAHFVQPDLAEHIRDLVDVYHVPHQYLEIELTESAFFDDKKALLNTVHKLQEYGFDVSMDDFGSGYSSLNSLKDLPLDVLKLDADFFRGDDFNTRGEIVVSKAISLAKQLNMTIVAEGVEKKEQVDFLARQNCDMIQGYYYAKPMPANEYARFLEDVNNPPAKASIISAIPLFSHRSRS